MKIACYYNRVANECDFASEISVPGTNLLEYRLDCLAPTEAYPLIHISAANISGHGALQWSKGLFLHPILCCMSLPLSSA